MKTGGIVAQQHDEIGAERIRRLNDGGDALRVHPWAASVQIGDCGDRQLESRRPLLGMQIVARDPEPPPRLDEKSVARGRHADGAKAGDPTQELPA
jgi:hypothetical protein